MAETFTTILLEHSNLETETPFYFTRYQMERLNVHDRERTGCSSENFLRPGQSIVTLSHLFRHHPVGSLKYKLERLPSGKRRIAYLADATADITGLELGVPPSLPKIIWKQFVNEQRKRAAFARSL